MLRFPTYTLFLQPNIPPGNPQVAYVPYLPELTWRPAQTFSHSPAWACFHLLLQKDILLKITSRLTRTPHFYDFQFVLYIINQHCLGTTTGTYSNKGSGKLENNTRSWPSRMLESRRGEKEAIRRGRHVLSTQRISWRMLTKHKREWSWLDPM